MDAPIVALLCLQHRVVEGQLWLIGRPRDKGIPSDCPVQAPQVQGVEPTLALKRG